MKEVKGEKAVDKLRPAAERNSAEPGKSFVRDDRSNAVAQRSIARGIHSREQQENVIQMVRRRGGKGGAAYTREMVDDYEADYYEDDYDYEGQEDLPAPDNPTLGEYLEPAIQELKDANRQEGYRLHDERQDKARSNFNEQEERHSLYKTRNNHVRERRANLEREKDQIITLKETVDEEAKLYERVGSTKWGKANPDDSHAWYEEARPIRKSYIEMEHNLNIVFQAIDNHLAIDPWKADTVHLEAYRTYMFMSNLKDLELCIRAYQNKLQEAADKIRDYQVDLPNRNGARLPKVLSREYAFGAANTVPHIHTYGSEFHLKILDHEAGKIRRLDLVKNNRFERGNMEEAIELATTNNEASLLRLLNQINDYYV